MVLPQVSPVHPVQVTKTTDISLEIDPTKVDVNVSPTKSEVHFLNQDEMIDAIVGAIQGVLAGANTSRSFTVQVRDIVSPVSAELMIRLFCLGLQDLPNLRAMSVQTLNESPLQIIKSVWTLVIVHSIL
jgi:hypothetical protein